MIGLGQCPKAPAVCHPSPHPHSSQDYLLLVGIFGTEAADIFLKTASFLLLPSCLGEACLAWQFPGFPVSVAFCQLLFAVSSDLTVV